MPLLEIEHLKKYFPSPRGTVHAVDDVSFSIEEGKTMGLVGESGCGKSTLGRTIIHLLDSTSGTIKFEGKDVTHPSRKELKALREKMQIIFQDPYSSLNPRLTIQDTIVEPLKLSGRYTPGELEAQADRLMDLAGIEKRFRFSYPHELDGGRRQRVGIARALALKPKFIVCDELVSALDVSIQAQILNLLMDLQEEYKLTCIFVTHDLSVVRHISTNICVMYLGQMVETCPTQELFDHPYHPYGRGVRRTVKGGTGSGSVNERRVVSIYEGMLNAGFQVTTDAWLDDYDRQYQNGVLGGVLSAMHSVCPVGGPVLLHSPTYTGFTTVLRRNGWKMVLSPLRQDADGVWRMDFADMEQKIKANRIHAAVFCSPHNPTGRVWERWELERAMEIFQKYDVTVISDEIWSDVILPGHRHIPTQSVSEDARSRTVALYAPSKTFNLAGLVGSYHIIYNPRLRDLVMAQSELSHYNAMNVLSMHALIAAYSKEGAAWVDELCRVLEQNIEYAVNFVREHFPGVTLSQPEGTYMLFLDCAGWCQTHNTGMDDLVRAGQEVGVIREDGRSFHGPSHIRMNLALPLSRVQEAFDRLDRYVFNK